MPSALDTPIGNTAGSPATLPRGQRPAGKQFPPSGPIYQRTMKIPVIPRTTAPPFARKSGHRGKISARVPEDPYGNSNGAPATTR